MITFDVDGMSCAHCVKAITKAIQSLDANADVHVDLAGKSVSVDRSVLSPQAIAAAISDAGYDVVKHNT